MATKKLKTPKAPRSPRHTTDAAPIAPATCPPEPMTAVQDVAPVPEPAEATPVVTAPVQPERRVGPHPLTPCAVCGETHASVLSYFARHRRTPYQRAEDLAWLRQHAQALGVPVTVE